MVPLGIAGAVSIRVAQATAAGWAESLRPIAFADLTLALRWLTRTALLLAFGGNALANLITDKPEMVAIAAVIFLVFATTQIADGIQSTILGALRGMSDTGWPALVSIIADWGMALPLGRALSGWIGPAGIWAGFFVALVGAGPALVVRFRAKTA